MSDFYITTPIYYVNDEPHIGHAYCTVLADVLAGYHRLLGNPSYFLTGTDEHGQKVQESADKNNITAQEHCDIYSKRFEDAWKELNIKNDDFIRTTEERHKKVVQDILRKVYKSKNEDGQPLIYAADYEGWYCKYEERYWTEKDLVEGNCPDCGRPVQKLFEKNYFFRMSYYQKWLIDYINDNPEFIQPDFRKNEVLGFLKQPLSDLCISRPKSRLSWGIELPFDDDYVCYVWFDALINYISAIGYDPKTGKFDKDQWWPAVHMIGKDILTTHAVYWPCMLKAIGLELPKTIFATGWWLMEGAKMSKSVGNIVKPLDLKDKYGVDPFRFYVIREMTHGQDSSFSEESFIKRYNSELANDLGNLLSRIMKMIGSYCEGKIPSATEQDVKDSEFAASREKLSQSLADDLGKFKLNSAADDIMAFVRSINRYIENKKPWELAKKGETDKLNIVLFNAANSLIHAAYLLKPIIPEKTNEIGKQLGYDLDIDNIDGKRVLDIPLHLKPGTPIQKGDNLFPRLQKQKPKPESKDEPKTDYVTYDDFKKLKFRVAEVIEAEKIEGADKLLKLQIQIGKEKRQIVAGIAKHYEADDLIGKKIIVIVNLEPANIRGVESNGMLLAASKGKELVVVSVDNDIDSGAKIS
ncbi:MAG: methionine--tRNA ligase [candidate division Zixibacteria bacterium]|nr:methionine--tRNA ligase [candidate division Zixibacteria bacterium]